MSAAVILTFGGGLLCATGAVFGYVAGRRSSREELAAAQMAWAVQNSAPIRDDLALPPERTGEHPQVQLYDQEAEGPFPVDAEFRTFVSSAIDPSDDDDPASLPRTVPPTYGRRLG